MRKGFLEKPHKFVTLDALRGVAALVIVYVHTYRLFGNIPCQHGYLAVDFFFMLSGFVLTFAYQGKLDQDWTTWAFFKARVARLYPLYFLGTVLGILFMVAQNRSHTASYIPAFTAFLLACFGLLLLPAPTSITRNNHQSFPLNFVSWSLFYEVVANIVHALFLRRASWKVLWAVVLSSGAVLIRMTIHYDGMDFGVLRSELFAAFSRLAFSYTMGIILCRVWRSGRYRMKISPVLSGIILLLALGIPIRTSLNAVHDLCITMLVFPVLLFASASSQPSTSLAAPFQILGTASYALYVLHLPFSELFSRTWFRVRRQEATMSAPWAGLIFYALIVAVALGVDKIYDLPARSFLRKRLT